VAALLLVHGGLWQDLDAAARQRAGWSSRDPPSPDFPPHREPFLDTIAGFAAA